MKYKRIKGLNQKTEEKTKTYLVEDGDDELQ